MKHDDRRYEKIRLYWDWSVTDLKTDIPVTDWKNPNESYVHTIQSIEAVSLQDRKGQITIDFRRVSVSPNKDVRVIICDRLEMELERYRKERGSASSGIDWTKITSGRKDFESFVITIQLHDEHHFSESLIPLVRHILDAFGVDDARRYRLSDFELEQQTMMKFEESWISYANWLRITNQLPVMNA